MGRKRQLERANTQIDKKGASGAKSATTKAGKKSVSFTATAKDGKIANGNSVPPNVKVSSSRNDETEVITIDDDSECTEPFAASGNGDMNVPRKQKRIAVGAETDPEAIPRKKNRPNGGSLLTLLPNEADLAKDTDSEHHSNGEEALVDPSEERDRLRTELEEAEKLEIAAVELRRKLFGSRIVSRTDVGDLGKDVKSLKRVFPCGGVMVREAAPGPGQSHLHSAGAQSRQFRQRI